MTEPDHQPEPDGATDHDLVIVSEPTGRNGSFRLTAKLGDQIIHADRVSLVKKSDRARFAADLVQLCSTLEPDEIEVKLLSCLAESDQAQAKAATVRGSARGDDAFYKVEGGRLCRMAATPFGAATTVPVCNFHAVLVAETIRDDGVELSRRLMIEGTLASGESLPPIEVSPEEFGRGDWPLTHWGSHAVVYAGQGNRDHLRVAVQLLSDRVVRRTVFTHLGWRQLGGVWVYLHAAGGIGPEGSLDSIAVDPPDALAEFRLPSPPTGESLKVAVQASLGLTRALAPDRVILPLILGVARAVLPAVDFSIHVCGPTGVFKSELLSLMQQHFGAAMHSRNLPASWSSTGNSLEAIAFGAKDAVLVVDDFAPGGNAADLHRYHREAERLFRAQGNRSGRQRLRPDGGLRPVKPPRGTILSSGEDIPRGHSLRARLLAIEVGPGDVDADRLTACQRDAAAGLYAQAMAGYLRWLAACYDRVRDELRTEVERHREAIAVALGAGQHRRTAAIVASLLAGFTPFLQFAQAVGALDRAEAEDLGRCCGAALRSVAGEQSVLHEASDPCGRYLALLTAALSSGRAHVASLTGDCPGTEPQPWGWRAVEDPASPFGLWQPLGRCIGWVSGEDLYLEPDAAFAEAQRLAGEQGGPLPVTQGVLHKRLHERHLLAGVDSRRGRLTTYRSIAGKRRYVLHLRVRQILDGSSDGPTAPEEQVRPPGAWYVPGIDTTDTTDAVATQPAENSAITAAPGCVNSPDGPDNRHQGPTHSPCPSPDEGEEGGFWV